MDSLSPRALRSAQAAEREGGMDVCWGGRVGGSQFFSSFPSRSELLSLTLMLILIMAPVRLSHKANHAAHLLSLLASNHCLSFWFLYLSFFLGSSPSSIHSLLRDCNAEFSVFQGWDVLIRVNQCPAFPKVQLRNGKQFFRFSQSPDCHKIFSGILEKKFPFFLGITIMK